MLHPMVLEDTLYGVKRLVTIEAANVPGLRRLKCFRPNAAIILRWMATPQKVTVYCKMLLAGSVDAHGL